MQKYKPRRLKDFSYCGEYIYFITICTDWKNPVFITLDIYISTLALLRKIAIKKNFALHSWCFMPDHVHLLTQGVGDSASLFSFVKLFKQESSFSYKKISGVKLWQDGYHEHVLRKEDDLRETVFYILQNPIRKGLVEKYLDYPYLGSDTFDIRLL